MKFQQLFRVEGFTMGLRRFMFLLLQRCKRLSDFMILFLQRWPGLPGVWFRPHGFCVTACIVAAQITGFQDQACAQTTARVGVCQTATGFARSPETSAVIGLPAPLRAIQTGNRSSSVLMSQGSIDVPLEFGNRVSWKLYDVGGREVQSGAANIPETGSRSIRVGSAQGLCVVVLTSADGLSVLRKAVFFER